MKPAFIFSAVVLLATACRKSKPAPQITTPAIKEVTFGVYAVHDYSGSASSPYGYKAASVKLTLEKFVKNASDVQAVWDTMFVHRPLSGFPPPQQQYRVQKRVPVLESKEQLHVKYEVWYGSLYDAPQRFVYGKMLEAGQNSLHVNVEL